MKHGFTFIELLVAIVIIGTLMVWVLPKFTKTVEKQHKQQVSAIEQARQVQQMLNAQQQARQRQLDNLK